MFNFLFFILGIIFGNLLEFLVHKYILHKLGKNKKSFFSSHWHRHHRDVRRNNFYDISYKNILSKNSHAKKEIIQILILFLLFFPIFFIQKYFYFGMIVNGILYFVIHRYIHLNPKFAQKYFKWHWKHHMGKNQDLYWCVTLPITDYIIYLFNKIFRKKK